MAFRTLTAAAALAALSIATPVTAQKHRELGAHVHGVSTLEVAIEGDIVSMNLRSPGTDIVGFEHEATSDGDKAAVASAIATLKSPETLFNLDESASCQSTEANAELASDEHDHEGHDGEEHHDGEGHAAGEHGAEHAAHEKHEGEEHEHAGHSEFRAHYSFTCATPDALGTIAFPFFDTFTHAQEIEASIVTDAGASQVEIGRDDPILSLR